jgi:Raf kinase inhibitor-like YbhB/YbcL family protein
MVLLSINLKRIILLILLNIFINCKSFTLKSTDISEGQRIDDKFTPNGDDVNPEFSWKNPPNGTKSFAFLVDDPDAPKGLFNHWAVFNIPENTREIQQGESPNGEAVKNNWGIKAYKGPFPPKGQKHNYKFQLYALKADIKANDLKELRKAIEENKIDEVEITAFYMRPKK